MKTGIDKITKERFEQINKHGFDHKHDGDYGDNQLYRAAIYCLTGVPSYWPWQDGVGKFYRDNIRNKSFEERLIVAGAFIAAQLDRDEIMKQAGLKYTEELPKGVRFDRAWPGFEPEVTPTIDELKKRVEASKNTLLDFLSQNPMVVFNMDDIKPGSIKFPKDGGIIFSTNKVKPTYCRAYEVASGDADIKLTGGPYIDMKCAPQGVTTDKLSQEQLDQIIDYIQSNEIIGRHGKPGPIGPRGIKGDTGPVGEPGVCFCKTHVSELGRIVNDKAQYKVVPIIVDGSLGFDSRIRYNIKKRYWLGWFRIGQVDTREHALQQIAKLQYGTTYYGHLSQP